jgi:hypothetical protein
MTAKSTSLRIAQLTRAFYLTDPLRGASRYLRTKGDLAICSNCCCNNQDKFATDNSWEIVFDRDNRDFSALFCDYCGNRIPMLRDN